MIKKENSDVPKFYRGMNMEVSMPTGSLCSERNVIGTALAADHTLHRREIKMIAVLSVELNKKNNHRCLHDDYSLGNLSSSVENTPEFSSLPSPIHLKKKTKYESNDHTSTSTNLLLQANQTTNSKMGPANKQQQQPLQRQLSLKKHRGGAGLNPTHPCGACNEWLKKISEVSPDFVVVTFTDESCEYCFLDYIS